MENWKRQAEYLKEADALLQPHRMYVPTDELAEYILKHCLALSPLQIFTIAWKIFVSETRKEIEEEGKND